MSWADRRAQLARLLWRTVRLALWIGIPTALGYALWRAPHMPFFYLQRVEIQGVRFVEADSLTAALRVEPGRSLFAPLDSLALRARAVPGVASVLLRRRLPGTVVLTVLETVPVAWSLLDGRLVLVDETASPLPFDPRGQRVRLPIAPRDTNVTRALGRLLALDASWFGQLDQAWPGPLGTVEVSVQDGRIRLPSVPDTTLIPDLHVVLTDLAHRGEQWDFLDASHGARFFVHRVRASATTRVIDSLTLEEPPPSGDDVPPAPGATTPSAPATPPKTPARSTLPAPARRP